MSLYLITTSDLAASRRQDLRRLLDSVDSNLRSSGEIVKMHLLLQNCPDDNFDAAGLIFPSWCRVRTIADRCSLSDARNHLLRAIEAEDPILDQDIIGFPDDDCWLPRDFLSRLMSIFRQRSELGVFMCKCSLQPESDAFDSSHLKRATIPQIVRLSSSNNVFYRGSVLKSVGLFDSNLGLGTAIGGSEDTDYAIKATLVAGAAGIIDRNLIGHTEPSRSSATKYFRGSLVVLMRHADRSPRLAMEFVRKLGVGFLFAIQRLITFKFFVESFVLAVKHRTDSATRGRL